LSPSDTETQSPAAQPNACAPWYNPRSLRRSSNVAWATAITIWYEDQARAEDMRLLRVERPVLPRQHRTTFLVADAPKEAVNGEAVSRVTVRGPRVGLLVGILVSHALTRDGLYDLVRTHVERYATVILRSLVRAKRYRPPPTRRIRVKVEGVRQIIPERPRTAIRLKAIHQECEVY
jgi:hypothetical protein